MDWSSTKPGQNLLWFASFFVVAVLQAWPLPLHLTTHLTGIPSSDAGAYVWNTWVFGRELIQHGKSPFSTDAIFALDPVSDLALHNYTVFANLVAIPLQPWFGVVGAFNLTYLLNVALAGFGMFVLARRFIGRTPEAWIAGALFACSPYLAARGTIHYSLVAAAPLPLFVYWLDRAWASLRVRDAIITGLMAAWAAFSDPYYLVYCAMLGVVYCAVRALTVVRRQAVPPARGRRLVVVLDVAIVTLAALIVGVHMIGGGTVRFASLSISMRTLYTPVLLLTFLVVARVVIPLRPVLLWRTDLAARRLMWLGAAGALAASLAIAPTLIAVVRRAFEGRMVTAPVLWRSSAPGVDLMAFVLPNPNHPLTPATLRDELTRQPGGFAEQVASFSLVGLFLIVAAIGRRRFRPPVFWVVVAVGFMSLSLGPFVHIFGINTHIPTPWAVLRYLPIVGAARMPPRFAVVAFMGFAMLVAYALVSLRGSDRRRWAWSLAGISAAMAFELSPAPRQLYSAEVPAIYTQVASDPRDVRLLDLPFGVRDGLSSIGDFSAASQFHQTVHGKSLVGGYLSRVTQRRRDFYLNDPFFSALLTLSEGRALEPDALEPARRSARLFLRRANLGYVVIDNSRASAALRQFAISVLGMTRIGESGVHELFVPAAPGSITY